MNDEVRAFGDDLKVIVCEQRCYLDNDMPIRVEAGHFEVHPCEHRARLLTHSPPKVSPCSRFH